MVILRDRLRRSGAATFRALVGDCATTAEVVGRFLALLELYRDGSVAFDQAAALSELRVRWTGGDSDEADDGGGGDGGIRGDGAEDDGGVDIDEEYG